MALDKCKFRVFCFRIPPRARKEAEYTSTHFLTLALEGCGWLASRYGRFIIGYQAAGAQSIGGSVGPRTGPDFSVKRKILSLPKLNLRRLSSVGRSLYLPTYPHSQGTFLPSSPPNLNLKR